MRFPVVHASTLLALSCYHDHAAAYGTPTLSPLSSFNSTQDTNGELGVSLVQHFKSTDLIAPHINQILDSDACHDGLYTFLTPRGFSRKASPQATILDSAGHLVWTTPWEDQEVFNLMVQTYKGEQVLTFWAGQSGGRGYANGTYYMLDNTYSVIKEFGGKDGRARDLHEFAITADNTALTTVFLAVNHTYGPPDTQTTLPVLDCVMQELDLETGDLIFRWSALEHVNVEDSYRDLVDTKGRLGGNDWFHMNSVDKDAQGNYLISSRYLHSLYYVDGTTGEILWILGGKQNMFEDLSGGRATNISGQHHARWADDDTSITLFNNDLTPGESEPRGLRLSVDQSAMTATVLQEYRNPTDVKVASQGSMQDLPNGNVLIGYGSAPAFTEFSREGRPVCQTQFAPISTGLRLSPVSSYRVLKFPWRGYPTEPPMLWVVSNHTEELQQAYVSWNGATEVKKWVLQGTTTIDASGTAWRTLESKAKVGFETAFDVQPGHPPYIRAMAVGDDGVLGMSGAASISGAKGTSSTPLSQRSLHIGGALVWVLVAVVGLTLWVAFMFVKRRRRRASFMYHPLPKEAEGA